MTTYKALETTIRTCANSQDVNAAIRAIQRATVDRKISQRELHALLDIMYKEQRPKMQSAGLID